MKLSIHNTIPLFVLAFLAIMPMMPTTVFAQDEPKAEENDSVVKPRINYISAKTLCPAHGVDRRIIGNYDSLQMIMDSIQRADSLYYQTMSDWCRQQSENVRSMINSLNLDYTREGPNNQIIWLDSTHCINDATSIIKVLEMLEEALLSTADNYDEYEEERQIYEKKKAEERERQRIRDERQLKARIISDCKDTIRSMNDKIDLICQGKTVTDKKVKAELKDIFISYKSIYNDYDLTKTFDIEIEDPSEEYSNELKELADLQIEILDSILGPNSIRNQISKFPSKLQKYAEKANHTEVYRSYNNAFKSYQLPIKFKGMDGFKQYEDSLRAVRYVQNSYCIVIILLDSIIDYDKELQEICANSPEVYRSCNEQYRSMKSEKRLIPNYRTVPESDAFIANLRNFSYVQHEFANSIPYIEEIKNRNDSILGACPGSLYDIRTAFQELVFSNRLVPDFINKASADAFYEQLEDYQKVQKTYITAFNKRLKIDSTSTVIKGSKWSPKALVTGYKLISEAHDLTPHFKTEAGGVDYITKLDKYIDLQSRFIKIIDNEKEMAFMTDSITAKYNNEKALKNIVKAYKKLLKTYVFDLKITDIADVNYYIEYQEKVLAMQKRFLTPSSIEQYSMSERLKKADIEEIKIIMGVVD